MCLDSSGVEVGRVTYYDCTPNYGKLFTPFELSGIILLTQIRQQSQCLGRTLLGMLLFVWLTMALVPCVMATEMSFIDIDNASSAMHNKMEHCNYCPDGKDGLNSVVLCQNAHANTSDSMNVAADVIDVASFVLFELPVVQPAISLLASNSSFNVHETPPLNRLSPLVMTGILRI